MSNYLALDAEWQKKRPRLAKKKCSSICAVAAAKLIQLGNKPFIHHILQIWSSAICFYFQSYFESNEEVIATTETYFARLQKTKFSEGLKKLKYTWVKHIKLEEY